ncbi:OmpA family protein [Aquabacterium sp.]|uniref:OmpA family protein n=1 Tax=Aquabacterium sp. TaxID=1872578 RepID=UPI002D0F55DF|nr:OmpA family protein [Aquabacterium sp.]HSW05677.1 OmpA family protein [Aquabacterium sp.]
MNRSLTMSALLGSLLLGACATTAQPPAALVEARATVRTAESDAGVLSLAPLELKKATDSLNRANALQAKGESTVEISSVAHVASQQAKTAMAIAHAKAGDAAIAGAEVERERARGDMRTIEANRAKAQAGMAQAQANAADVRTGVARQQAVASEQRASNAETQAAMAQAGTADAQAQTAVLQQRLNDMQAKQTDRGMLVTLGDVLFEFNRAEVKPAAQGSLRKLADFLQQYPNRRILIEGHTDNIGSAGANETLSRNRAQAVDTALIGLGVAGQRMAVAGYGKDYPVAENNTETNRALNRRVEIYIAENDQPVRSRR